MARDPRVSRRQKPLTPHQQDLTRQGKNAAARRREWETGDLGRERMAEGNPAVTNIPVGMQYELNQWGEQGQAETGHPRHYDRQLPGMEDPHAAAPPPRWEDIPRPKQVDISRRVKARGGATMESMTQSFGAQLDQSYLRAEREGAPRDPQGRLRPQGQDFYTSGEPKQVIRKTAQDHGVPQQLVAAMHADNSPNTSFQRPDPNDPSKSVYPQDVMTRSALEQIQSGVGHRSVERPPRAEGYTVNFEKSARRANEVLWNKKPVNEAGAKHGFGPKTAAYMNSWLASEPDFFVSDVHSGGSMVPHQSTNKPARLDAEGNPIMQTVTRGEGTVEVPRREKSEREKTIETAGFHSMADYAARQALQQRGLGSIRQAQAAQWNEERVQRFGTHRSYDPAERNSLARRRRQIEGQGSFFGS